MNGRRPDTMTAAAARPSSSPPSTAIAGLDEDVNAATRPSPALRLPPPSAAAVIPELASEPAPTKIEGLAADAPVCAIGRSIADVSNPRRAATFAAAESSAVVGRPGNTIFAFTKSIAPSPFVSRRATPGLKNSDSDIGGAPDGSVRPNAPAHTTRTVARRTFFIVRLPNKSGGQLRLCTWLGGEDSAEAVRGECVGYLLAREWRQQGLGV